MGEGVGAGVGLVSGWEDETGSPEESGVSCGAEEPQAAVKVSRVRDKNRETMRFFIEGPSK